MPGHPYGSKKDEERFIEARESIRNSRLLRAAGQAVFYTILNAFYISSFGRDFYGMSLREVNRFPRSKGLIDGAIIGDELFHPDPMTKELTCSSSTGGRWAAYDFNRPAEAPLLHKYDRKLLYKGGLVSFCLDEIIDNPAHVRTPTTLFHMSYLDHFLALNTATIDELTDHGLVKQTTHEEAYREAGLYKKYANQLAQHDLTNNKIYQVTPKGNTLVFVTPDGGDKEPREDQAPFALRKFAFGFSSTVAILQDF